MTRDGYIKRASDILKRIHDNTDNSMVDPLEAELIELQDEIMSVYGDHREVTKIMVKGGSLAGIYKKCAE